MKKTELLDMFAEIATSVEEGTHKYWDASEPENMAKALKFYYEHLGFLGSRDKRELLEVWQQACDDGRELRLFFNAIKVLKDKYDESQESVGCLGQNSCPE